MIGAGTKFYRSVDGTPTSWTQIAKVLDLSAPSLTRGSSENSYLEDAANTKSYEPGVIDPGECDLTLEWDKTDAAQVLLKADFETKSNFHYGILYPDGTFDSWLGHMTEWGKETPKEETIKRKVKFKLASTITEGVFS